MSILTLILLTILAVFFIPLTILYILRFTGLKLSRKKKEVKKKDGK